jgi:hypothetical protein
MRSGSETIHSAVGLDRTGALVTSVFSALLLPNDTVGKALMRTFSADAA